MTYRVFICQAAVDAIANLRGKQRDQLAAFVRSLEADPYNEGDFRETDSSGRDFYTKVIQEYAVSYYPDHAVKEVKVIEVSRADR